ncbi:MAG TPA: DUF4167 domain-containing protein [Erythrobacter sp.]|nr:DUF4167 domain-containing protein [Erythrobacter sp.]
MRSACGKGSDGQRAAIWELRGVTKKEELSLNSNRSNRRRGRGNRNQGGGNALNRIDSRARGNAPQLLDKYKKLAQDAQHNGDRVQAEYYLQFADHYFRVIADNKARQEEARAKRAEEREQSGDDGGSEIGEREDRDDRCRGRHGWGPDERREAEGERGAEREAIDDGEHGSAKEAKPRRPRRKPSEAVQDGNGEIDASVLPPAISADEGDSGPLVEEKRPRRRKPKSESDEGEGGVQAIG